MKKPDSRMTFAVGLLVGEGHRLLRRGEGKAPDGAGPVTRPPPPTSYNIPMGHDSISQTEVYARDAAPEAEIDVLDAVA